MSKTVRHVASIIHVNSELVFIENDGNGCCNVWIASLEWKHVALGLLC